VNINEKIPRYTHKDYLQWEGDWELIDGYPYAMSPSPKLKHQLVGRNLVIQISQGLTQNSHCDCTVVYELDWVIDDATVVRPDVMVVCGPLVPDDFLRYPPTVAVEILSESTRFKDRNTKYNIYEQQGVKYYLMADVDKELVELFELMSNQYRSIDPASVLILKENCRLRLELSSIFRL
jgi:Uma2 family endonuclease